jgi:serine/threonine protein kinase
MISESVPTSNHHVSRRTLITDGFGAMFRIEAVLGEGGMGRVYAAHDTNLDRAVAIKVLHERFANDGQMAARFLREARLMARLSSVNTVRVHGIGRDDQGAPFIVMERASGCDLDALVEARGPLPLDEALEYSRQMCVAIAEAHAHGIVHRDIKPRNVLVGAAATGEPLVKVVDFGVAKEDRPAREEGSGLTSMSALLGTPEYMSPEQLRSTRDVDHRADIWSLGATLYFMLTGAEPFVAEDLQQLVDRIQHGPTPSVRTLRPDVPPHIDAAIERCFHRDAHGRFRSAGDLAAALTISMPGSSGRLPSFETPNTPFEPTAVMPAPPSSEDSATDVIERTLALPFARPEPPPPASARTAVVARARPAWIRIALALILGIVVGGALASALERSLRPTCYRNESSRPHRS